MNKNKKEDMRPFDMTRPPKRIPWYILPLMWGGSFVMTRASHLKIKKVGMSEIKPPYLVISTHQGFSDYYIAPLALFPYRANYVSDMEGFAAFGYWLYRSIGCIGKRRYVSDVTVLQNMYKCIEAGDSVVLFPESRHANVGTTSKLPKNLGQLAKHFAKKYGTPLVILSAHGSYLTNPFWDEEHTRKGRMEATLEKLYTSDELLNMDADEVQSAIEKKLQYDEYAWQQENGIEFIGRNLAKGLEGPLYQCISCGKKYAMISKDDRIGCTSCRKVWKLSPRGFLYDTDGRKYQIPEWYEWERHNATSKIEPKRFKVRIEALPNEHGFVNLGEGRLVMNDISFTLHFKAKKKYNYIPKDWKIAKTEDGDEVRIEFSHEYRESLQTEYNYKGNGMAIVLSNQDATYYIYSDDKRFNPTELQFIAEALTRC